MCKRSSVSRIHRPWRYSDDVRQLCIKMYLNGMGLRGIERVTNIHHTTVMHWAHAGHELTDAPASDEIQKLLTWMNCKRVGKSDKKSGSDCRESLAFGHPGLWETVRKRSSACGGLSVLAELLVWSAMAIRFIQCSLKTIPSPQ